MDKRKDIRYKRNLQEHIHVMSFARELILRDISCGGISFYSPKYEKGDEITLTITIPKLLQIFQEKIIILSDNNEPFIRAKFINPSEDFLLSFKEFMENKNE